MKNKKLPTAFIGCAESQKDIAEAIQYNLQETFETEIWNQGAFKLGQDIMGNLINGGCRFDFAILVLTPDEYFTHTGEKVKIPRGNLILEYGFFAGILGKERTFLVCEKAENFKLPSDMDGIVIANFQRPNNISLNGALGAACSMIKEAARTLPPLHPDDGRKDDDLWIDNLVRGALKVICRTFEVPLPDLGAAKFRAFIFKREENFLVCTHFWAFSNTKENVGILKFEINDETSKQVAVVKAAINKETIAVKVKPLEGIDADVDENLCFILAAPIIGPNGEVWGTVDIDTFSNVGARLLNNQRAKEALFELGQHLFIALTRKRKKHETLQAVYA